MTVRELKEKLGWMPERDKVYFEDFETGGWHEVTQATLIQRQHNGCGGVGLISDAEDIVGKK